MSQIEATAKQLQDGSIKQQLTAIEALTAVGDKGYSVLIDFLRNHPPSNPQIAAGKAYQVLWNSNLSWVKSFLDTELPNGIFLAESAQSTDYSELQQNLIIQNYELADRITSQKLCELAGPDAVARKWVYFTEVDSIPTLDLQTIDRLWGLYSENRFGFSKQRELWLGLDRNWERLWDKLAWKSGNVWTRYPTEFTWNLSAPLGHLPLSNQLRGVRTMESLLCHPAWT